ncbi:hypothetical protein [Streptomyces sp. WAC06614]|uniref:hypothetical protein n=1 Tax=Streptomyces sp. WAC06614 TaxID=2487416 RepID=UPI000F791AD1|nr:hypothetical protein [Streptomyces sp. WAC06614]RSS80786.1 hypothetical protein EF918_12465 [Streptomyces sp. WAC06614]
MFTFVLGRGLSAGEGVPPRLMEEVVIPPGLAIDVWALDQGAWYGPDDREWTRFALSHGRFTCDEPAPNHLALHYDEAFEDPTLLDVFSGRGVMLAGCHGLEDPLRLCHGTPGRCPTTQEEIQQGLRHRCDGVLGLLEQYEVGGEVRLVLSAKFTKVTPAPARARPARTRDEAGRDPRADIERRNKAALEGTEDGGTVHFALGRGLLLLSRYEDFRRHSRSVRQTLDRDRSLVRGELTVHHASPRTNSPALVLRCDLTGAQRNLFTRALAPAWAHEVIFTTDPHGGPPPVRTSYAEKFCRTEPRGRDWEFDTEAARDANRRALNEVPPATHLADPRNNINELHYTMADGMLLLSRDPKFGDHAPVNKRYVKARRDAEDFGTGILVVYLPAPGYEEEWRIHAAPDNVVGGMQQHQLRLAVQKLGRYTVSF